MNFKVIMDISVLNPKEQFLFDQKRKIDYVIVLKEDPNVDIEPSNQYETETTRLLVDDADQGDKHRKLQMWREKFLVEIQKQGLVIEEHYDELFGYPYKFIKVHGTFQTLRQYAEDLEIEVPIQEVQEEDDSDILLSIPEKILSLIRIPIIMYQELPNPPKQYYTTPFRDNDFEKYYGHENESTFFSASQRSAIVYEILAKTAYGNEKTGEIGIDGLVSRGGFYAAYPIHDGPYKDMNADDVRYDPLSQIDLSADYNERRILFEYWGKWRKWYKYQPLHRIRNYFGEKVAIYFAWIGMYTTCLIPAALFGLAVLFYGLSTLSKDSIIIDMCDVTKNITLCPTCDTCPTQKLSSGCDVLKAGHVFSNWMTLVYTIFMSLWTVLFLVLWKRKAASLANAWGSRDYKAAESLRPEFCAKAPYKRINKITWE